MAEYTAVQDRLNLSTEDKSEIEVLRDYLRANPADDHIIELIYNAVKSKADSYMKNDFDGKDIPESIKLWVLQMVNRKYNRRANGISSEGEDGMGSLSWNEEEMQELQEYRKLEFP